MRPCSAGRFPASLKTGTTIDIPASERPRARVPSVPPANVIVLAAILTAFRALPSRRERPFSGRPSIAHGAQFCRAGLLRHFGLSPAMVSRYAGPTPQYMVTLGLGRQP